MTEPKKVMIIDDDPDFVAGIQSILEGAGYRTEVAYNPKDGYAALRARPHDVLLLDIMMGRGAEGVMMARKIRKDPALADLPILIITGIREQIAFMFPGQAVHPNFVALNELIEKPVEPELLLERVEALLTAAATARGDREA